MDKIDKDAGLRPKRGQAMVEYALILALLALSMGAIIWATGPAIGNVFCNVVFNVSGQTADVCGQGAALLADQGGEPALFWQTVTWVAQNRQRETPFPTPILRPPTDEPRVFRSPTPTNTFTPTDTPSITPTPSSTQTSTPGPSPTPSDLSFTVPHVDQMNHPDWWRIDTDLDLDFNGQWSVEWYDTRTGATDSSSFTWSDLRNTTTIDSMDIDLNFADTVIPPGSGLSSSTNYAAIFTRTLTLSQAETFLFRYFVNDNLRVEVDGVTIGTVESAYNWGSATHTFSGAGTYTLRLIFGQVGNISTLRFYSEKLTTNPDDTRPVVADPSNPPTSCRWGQESDDANAGSRVFVFDENPSSDSWTAGSTCNLELRGSIDLSPAVNPVLSFWDYWDFVTNSGASAQIQLGNYVLSGGVLDRGAFNWCTIPLHAGGTANYNWTRSQIDIRSQCPSLGNLITVRFVASSPDGGVLRWRVDDLQVLDTPASPSTYTVNAYWSLNSRSQMSQFLFNADSDHNVVDVYPALPDNTGARRWDLTSNITRDGTGWDDSPGNFTHPDTNDNPDTGSNSPYRIHYLEINGDIDVTNATITSGGRDTDWEGDTGVPVLSFWFAYDVPVGNSVRVQWSRAPRSRTGITGAQPDGWADVADGILLNYDLPGGAPGANEQPTRSDTAMQYIEVPLSTIPNASTEPFRLRIAFYMTENYPVGGGGTPTATGDGIYIDDIRIERQSTVGYVAYPYLDEAEDSVQSARDWLSVGSSTRWGRIGSPQFGALGTSTSYTDSPSGNYSANSTTMLQLKRQIDLMNDTVENDVDPSARAAAVDPTLSFYFVRRVNEDEIKLAVDLWSPVTSRWDEVWAYTSAADTEFRTQVVWERAEISLKQALATATGVPWATIISDANTYNDDFRIRFRFLSGGDISADGVYVDQIEIKNALTYEHNLWTTGVTTGFGTGGGVLEDSIDFVAPVVIPGAWDARWYSADWDQTNAAGYVRRGSLAITDSLGGEYGGNSRNIFEYIPVIDLRSAVATDLPRLFFWTRYAINDDDNFRVEIAVEDGSATQSYDKIAGWSAWTPRSTSVTGASDVAKTSTQVDTWVREDVDLRPFVGYRIRVRFVMNAPNNTFAADGVYIDDITFSFGTVTHPLTFLEDGQSVARWITEGSWGITEQYFAGSGTSAANLGGAQWRGYFFDCENNGGACTSDISDDVAGAMDPILAGYPNLASPPTTVANRIVGPNVVPDINYSWSSTDLPPGAGDAFYNDWAARWILTSTLTAGTYKFQTLSDDGIRLWIDDATGTSLEGVVAVLPTGAPASAGMIINNWTNHATTLDYGQLTVYGALPLTRGLYLDYFENAVDARITLSVTRDSYSYSDSPNTGSAGTWSVVPSVVPGNSSLMINGFLNLSNVASSYFLRYQRMWQAHANNSFYVEVSTDGGFTWTTIASETIAGGTDHIRPFDDWEIRTVNLNTYRATNVTLRFRVDTRSATTGGDGYYITNIEVREN